MNRTARIIGLAAAVILLIVLVITTLTKQSCEEPAYKIFGSLDEFSCFDNYETEELPDPQGAVDGLNVTDRRCFSVSFEGYDFNVYAYVFSDGDEAAAFAARCGEGDGSNGMLYDVSRENRALLVTGGANRSKQFLNYLFENLTVTVDYTPDGE